MADVNRSSCERCKKRKSRCDRKAPACSRCNKARAECVYGMRKRPGFAAGHRQDLEDKIERVEAALRSLGAGDSSSVSTVRDSTVWPSIASPTVPDLQVPARQSVQHSMRPPLRPSTFPLGLADDHFTSTAARTQRVAEKAPPMDLLVSLSSLYFHHIHPWFPMLDARRLMGDLGSTDEGSLIHYALFGISLPFSFDSRLDTLASDSFWKYSKRRILMEVLEEPSYSSLEALTILSLDLSGMTNGAQVWGPLAVAVRLATQLRTVGSRNFRPSADQNPRSTQTQQDQKSTHRLFWAIYALNCYVTVTTSHAPELLDRDIAYFMSDRALAWHESGAPLSARAGNQQATSSIDPPFVYGYHLQTLDYARQVHKIYMALPLLREGEAVDEWITEASQCSAGLLDWSAKLPHSLQIRTVFDTSRMHPRCLPSLLTLHAYWCALHIHLNSLMGLSTLPETPRTSDVQYQAHEHCLRAVENLEGLACRVESHTMKQLGWPYAWCIWVALRYLLIRQYRAVMPTSHAWDTLYRQLQMLGNVWQIAGKYLRMLDQATSELQESMTDSLSVTPKFLLSFIDITNSTADLEDQSRVDPVLQQTDNVQEQVSPVGTGALFDFASGNDRDMTMEASGISERILQESEIWYNMPLFATSAYQQLPHTDFGSAEEFM